MNTDYIILAEFFAGSLIVTVIGVILALIVGTGLMLASFFKKVKKGTALVRTGIGGTKVASDGGN